MFNFPTNTDYIVARLDEMLARGYREQDKEFQWLLFALRDAHTAEPDAEAAP